MKKRKSQVTHPVGMLWSQLTQQGMTFQAQHKAHNGLQPRMRHEPLGPLFMCRSRNQLYVTATTSSMVLSRRVDHPVICMVKIEFLLRFNGQQLVFWNYMGDWRLCSKDRIHTNWQIEPTFKYLQEQELPKQSRSNSGQFQMSRLVHRNHSARKTRTNRKLALRQSSAVHSTWNNFDRTRVNDKKREKSRRMGPNGAKFYLQVTDRSDWLVENPLRRTHYNRDLVTWRRMKFNTRRADIPTFSWHISPRVPREFEIHKCKLLVGQPKWAYLSHSMFLIPPEIPDNRHGNYIGNYRVPGCTFMRRMDSACDDQ